MEDWCKSFIRENDVNIEMRGFVPNNEALKIIANSKALVLPTQCYEGFPMRQIEEQDNKRCLQYTDRMIRNMSEWEEKVEKIKGGDSKK